MIDLAIGAAVVAGLLIPDFVTRHQRALRKSVFKLQVNDVESAERILSNGWIRHAFPWEQNRRSLCRLLHAHVQGLLGDPVSGLQICETLLADETLPTSLKGLTYLRLAAFNEGTRAAELSVRGEDLWAEGINDLTALRLWDDIGYLLWAMKDSARAAYCIDRALEGSWNSQNLYLRYVFYSESGVSRDEQLQMAEIALEHNKIVHQKAALLHVISSLHLLEGRYQEASRAFEHYRSLRVFSHPHFVDRYTILLSRAAGEYGKAEAQRDQLFNNLLSDEGLVPMLGILHDDGEYERGMAMLSAHQDSPDPQMRYALGTFHLEMGDPVTAASYFEPDYHLHFAPSSQYNLVRCYAMLCRRDMVEEYLCQLAPAEKDLERAMRVHLAYFWDGDPETAERLRVNEEFCQDKVYYEGDHQRYLDEGGQHWEKISATLPLEFKTARVLFHRASAHQLAERWTEAAQLYGQAESCYTGSPYDRALCRMRQLACRAELGEFVGEAMQALRGHLESLFPNALHLHRELESMEIQVTMCEGRHQEVIDRVTAFVESENRSFYKATELKRRAITLQRLGRSLEAQSDCRTILEIAPGSYLARWAQSQLGG